MIDKDQFAIDDADSEQKHLKDPEVVIEDDVELFGIRECRCAVGMHQEHVIFHVLDRPVLLYALDILLDLRQQL